MLFHDLRIAIDSPGGRLSDRLGFVTNIALSRSNGVELDGVSIWDQRWSTNANVTRDRFRYKYDAAGNRTWREAMDNQAFGGAYYSEYYVYDGLNRLTDMKRGQLTGTPYTGVAGTASRQETFGLSGIGNWNSYTVLLSGSATLNQTRTHNKANEITSIAQGNGQPAWTSPTYDAAGNMTTGVAGTNNTYKYDAWNRLVKVDGVAVYQYDGLHRRIAKLLPNGNNWDRTDYYYSDDWQVIEERKNTVANQTTAATTPRVQWVWSTEYIDTPIRRVRDTAGNGTWGETLYYTTDANMNVTALIDTSGTIVERTIYDTYGKPTFHTGSSFATASATSSCNNEVLFCGYRWNNETGTYHVRNRDYDPLTGRWTRNDPAGPIDGLNLYQYVRSNPITHRDPSGLAANECFCGPDITTWLAIELGIWLQWVDAMNKQIDQWVDAETPWYVPNFISSKNYRYAFMLKIGPQMTYFPNTTFKSPNCPTLPQCMNTVTVSGTCIHVSEVGNFVFAAVARWFEMTWLQTWGGSVYGNRGKRTDADAAGVSIGFDYADAEDDFATFMSGLKASRLKEFGSDAPAQCKPCTEKVTALKNHVKLPAVNASSTSSTIKITVPKTVD